jgi:hypothetical protein
MNGVFLHARNWRNIEKIALPRLPSFAKERRKMDKVELGGSRQ